MLRLRLILPLAVLAASACRSTPQPSPEPVATAPAQTATPAAPAEPVRLTVVGLNDLHGWIAPQRTSLKGGIEVQEGGAATLAAYLTRLRADNPGGVVFL